MSGALGDARDALAGAQQLPSVVMGDLQTVAEADPDRPEEPFLRVDAADLREQAA